MGLFFLEKIRFLGIINVFTYLSGGCNEDKARLLSEVSKRKRAPAATEEVPSKHQEALLYCKYDSTLAQVAH